MSGPDPHERRAGRGRSGLGLTVAAIVLAVVIAMIVAAVVRLT